MGALEKSVSPAAAAEHRGSNNIASFSTDDEMAFEATSTAVDPVSVRQNPLTGKSCPVYPPLSEVTAPTVGTAAAAYYLNRRPQTLRIWASMQTGPLASVVINGRRAWSVDSIRALHSGLAVKPRARNRCE